MISLCIIMPVHNEAAIIEETLKLWQKELEARNLNNVPVILVENGSSDDSFLKIQNLEKESFCSPTIKLRSFHSPDRGMGYAYQLGLEKFFSESSSDNNLWVMLTVADLPFGFTDFNNFFEAISREPDTAVFIGSKSAKNSQVDMGVKRKIANLVFRFLRRVFLGIKVKDTQGVFFLRSDVIKEVYSSISARNFFYTTELVYLLEQKKISIKEIPVIYQGERRKSSVRIVKDGVGVVREMLRLLKG
jgi:glycosyltransferase involved in cell wall biosynthesis